MKYLPLLKRFAGIISPDYSIHREMPLALQIWNTYRNRALSYWMQANGIKIVPNVRWGDERTYSFAFEGIPIHSSVAISTNGCIQDKLDRYYFRKGLEKMVEVLHPSAIINYSQTPSDIFSPYLKAGLPIISIENYQITVRKAVK